MESVSEFPGCNDLRSEAWRLVSYQFVHAGYKHITFNMALQAFLGLPLNMVHGSVRFGIIYELCVIGGAFCFAVGDGAPHAVVGCSGGVYGLFGMHVAELIINWDSDSKGIINHWTRLGVIAMLLGLDMYLFFSSKSHATSYTAHVGGFLAGLLAGTVTILNLEVSWLERNVLIPGAWILTIVLTVFSCGWYAVHWPPEAVGFPKHGVEEYQPCCFSMLRCAYDEDFDTGYFDLFSCSSSYDSVTTEWSWAIKGNGTVLDTCSAIADVVRGR